jgi:hypothetical protein
MNDSEFIALLNLYVDHEISASDAIRLEAEVLSDPKRRQIYRQYCQMDKACSILAAQFTEDTVHQVKIEEPRRDWSNAFYSAGLAAAACIAIFLAIRHQEPSSKSTAPQFVAVTNQSPSVQQGFQQVAYQQPALQSVVALRDLTLTSAPAEQSNTLINQVPNNSLAWMQQMQQVQMQMQLQAIRQMQTPAGMNINQLRVLPVALPVELTPSYNNQPDVQVQNAAFHFQR